MRSLISDVFATCFPVRVKTKNFSRKPDEGARSRRRVYGLLGVYRIFILLKSTFLKSAENDKLNISGGSKNRAGS